MHSRSYIGRYAPSPTGDLHLGNLRTALFAWLHARLNDGLFLLRIEDLDKPRVRPGSEQKILEDLEALGIDWDQQVVYQSQRTDLYQSALELLTSERLTYPCFCSRADIRNASSAPHGAAMVYPGTCSQLSIREVDQRCSSRSPAIRLRVPTSPVRYLDHHFTAHEEHLTQSCGDFVLKRSDGLFAYQLAVVVDDLEQGITDVVRGRDLADSTARQVYLAQCLAPEIPQINYTHVPLLLDQNKQRMAKRDGSQSLAMAHELGKTTQQLVGEFAAQLGLIKKPTSISAQELLQELSIEQLLNSSMKGVSD